MRKSNNTEKFLPQLANHERTGWSKREKDILPKRCLPCGKKKGLSFWCWWRKNFWRQISALPLLGCSQSKQKNNKKKRPLRLPCMHNPAIFFSVLLPTKKFVIHINLVVWCVSLPFFSKKKPLQKKRKLWGEEKPFWFSPKGKNEFGLRQKKR